MGKKSVQLPTNIIHYKAAIPELCDSFWAVLVVILQEYFEDPENFKLVIFGNRKTPKLVYDLLLTLNLDIGLIWISRGDNPSRQSQRVTTVANFAERKDGILVLEGGTIDDGFSLPCTQAIEVGAGNSGVIGTSRRMQMLQKASEAAGKRGHFITIYTPHEIEDKDMQVGLLNVIMAAEPYQIDLLENANLFRRRFNQIISNAFSKMVIDKRVSYYNAAIKLRRRRHELVHMSDQSIASLQQSHRCAAVMALPFTTIRAIDTQSLTTSPVKLSPQWLAAEGTSFMYEDAAIVAIMRFLHLPVLTEPSISSISTRSIGAADKATENGTKKSADVRHLSVNKTGTLGRITKTRKVKMATTLRRTAPIQVKTNGTADMVDLTGDPLEGRAIDLTMED